MLLPAGIAIFRILWFASARVSMLLLMVLLYPAALASPQPLLLSVKLSENKGTAFGRAIIVPGVETPLLPLLLTKEKIPPPTTSISMVITPIMRATLGSFPRWKICANLPLDKSRPYSSWVLSIVADDCSDCGGCGDCSDEKRSCLCCGGNVKP